MGAARHFPEQKSTASPFVATFPATNLLVLDEVELSIEKYEANSTSKHTYLESLTTKLCSLKPFDNCARKKFLDIVGENYFCVERIFFLQQMLVHKTFYCSI